MEFADKLLEYKYDRTTLIRKIQNVYDSLEMNLPKLESDEDGNYLIPTDICPFTIFALFNKRISVDNRIKLVNQIKEEFSLKTNTPFRFHGIPIVNNLKASFYSFKHNRGEKDIDNLWELFDIALNFSEDKQGNFVDMFNKILSQKGIKWNITMGLYWIRPYDFISLDSKNRDLLSSDEIFSKEFRNEIKSLKSPTSGEKYLKICKYCKDTLLNKTEKYDTFPDFSLSAHHHYFKINEEVSDDGIGDNDVKTVHYWLISPGRNAKYWDEFYENGIAEIGMSGTGDLSRYQSKEEIRLKFQEIFNDNKSHRNDVNACWQFVNEMQIGDIVFAKKGTGEILGRGIIESDYYYDDTKSMHNIRKVNWTHKGNWFIDKNLIVKTLTDITIYKDLVNKINEFFIDEETSEDKVEIEYPIYNQDKFLEEVYIDEDKYNTLVNLLMNKKNLIVQGAPGVGKTFMAKRLAYSIMGQKDINRVMMVQFHQSYSYEDFVMGYRPSKEGFELRSGSFYNFCKVAEEDSENEYFFIIDEINRGNLSKIFGELFMLIEADKRGEKNKIQLLYSDELFFIPKNVYIIGLMNTADRSLAMIDYALRRRFAFFDLKPGFDTYGFKDYQKQLNDYNFDNLIEVMKELNQEIREDESLGGGFRIGHSYLCNIKAEDLEDKLNYIVEYELIPLLKEYWFDEAEKIEYWSNKLRSVIDDSF